MAVSRSLNKVMLIGNLTRDPVLKKTANDVSICTFGIATNETWSDAGGVEKENAEFHSIVAWNKVAEVCAQILSIGMLVYIEGSLRTRTWADDNGIKHFRTEIKVEVMKVLDSKGKSGVGVDAAMQVPNNEDTHTEPIEQQVVQSDTNDDNLF